MYKIIWEKKALKELSKLSKEIETRVFTRTNITLAQNPYHGESLQGIYKVY
jgi:mRNA-degrading endonuclease RelE of RelBE toxin-antitoxin system